MSLLRKLHVAPSVTVEEIYKAETENALRDHADVMIEVSKVADRTRAANARLLSAIGHAKAVSAKVASSRDPLAELVAGMKTVDPPTNMGTAK